MALRSPDMLNPIEKSVTIVRPDDDLKIPQNIMFNRRVCRGSNYPRRAAEPLQPTKTSSPNRHRNRHQRNRSLGEHPEGSQPGMSNTPEPVLGRQHSQVQTATYLEILDYHPDAKEQDIQTDTFLDRPESPRFVPVPSGESKGTQIMPGDLFDFGIEVEPILEVLVGKVIDQSIMEVIDENELHELKVRRDQFEQIRNVELAETQRIEARETRLFEEKQRRKVQEKERVRNESVLSTKLAARTAAKNCLEGLQANVLSQLKTKGHFGDPVVQEVENQFIPWIASATSARIAEEANSIATIRDVVNDAVYHQIKDDTAIADARKVYYLQEHERRLKEFESKAQEPIVAATPDEEKSQLPEE